MSARNKMPRRNLLPILLALAAVVLFLLAAFTRLRLLSYAALGLAAAGAVLWSRKSE